MLPRCGIWVMSSRDDVDLSDWETIEPTQQHSFTASAAPARQHLASSTSALLHSKGTRRPFASRPQQTAGQAGPPQRSPKVLLPARHSAGYSNPQARHGTKKALLVQSTRVHYSANLMLCGVVWLADMDIWHPGAVSVLVLCEPAGHLAPGEAPAIGDARAAGVPHLLLRPLAQSSGRSSRWSYSLLDI